MCVHRSFLAALVLTIAASAAFAQTTSQQSRQRPSHDGKRLTYEEAWKRCAPFARQVGDETQRYLRGAACMKHFGHNI
jgi:hypothetical protein